MDKKVKEFNDEMMKLSKETYYELDLIDKELLKIKSSIN